MTTAKDRQENEGLLDAFGDGSQPPRSQVFFGSDPCPKIKVEADLDRALDILDEGLGEAG